MGELALRSIAHVSLIKAEDSFAVRAFRLGVNVLGLPDVIQRISCTPCTRFWTTVSLRTRSTFAATFPLGFALVCAHLGNHCFELTYFLSQLFLRWLIAQTFTS